MARRIAILCLAVLVAGMAQASPATVATPVVTGPIVGGSHGRPFTAALIDLSKFGYVEEEYFLEGSATAYAPAPGHALDPDGRWTVVPTGQQPYKTRILVRRPTDPKRFNGTVVVEWMQSSAGFDKDVNWNWQKDEFLRDGYAWIGVSAQREGVDGSPHSTLGFMDLVRWDAARYGTLHIPSEDLAYDIFSQVGKIVGRDRPRRPVDPLGGLSVQKVLPIGDTFAADHLVVYYNAFQPLAGVYDGFFIGWRHIPGGAPLAAGSPAPTIVRLRTDLHAPVFVVNTAAETLPHYPVRQPDSDTYRLWEIAGSAHTNAYWIPQMYAINQRDFGMPIPVCDRPFNEIPNQYVMNAAIWHLNRWVRNGAPPSRFPPITIAGSPPAIEHDEFGNTAGGVRLPQVTAPVARYESGGDPKCPGASGFTAPFSAEQLKSLYPTRDAYLSKFSDEVRAAEKAGFLLPADAEDAVRLAARTSSPR